MDPQVKQLVRQRANHRCEYCQLPQNLSPLRFHVEHIMARQHGGSDTAENLALACPECNLRKGTNLTGVDPDTGKDARIFNPRSDPWLEHFAMDGPRILGKTPSGRTTAWLLRMNSISRLRLRELSR